MYNYNAYNLGVNSALPLPELEPSAEVGADITIRLGRISWSPQPDTIRGEELCFQISDNEANFYWDQLGKFSVRGGKEIVLDPRPGVEERLLRLPLLGTILAVLLHQRGYLVLHASAVAINGESIIFIGGKGRGKSTMAATLYGRGHHLIADDVVALTFEADGCPMVIPGFPQFKLYPEALVSSLGDDPVRLPELADGYEKRGRQVTDRFARHPLPVRSIYVLGQGQIPTIEELDPQAALFSLIANSYMGRFGRHLLQGAEASVHLRHCVKLVSHVPVCRLERPGALSLLPTVAQLVEDHVQQNKLMTV